MLEYFKLLSRIMFCELILFIKYIKNTLVIKISIKYNLGFENGGGKLLEPIMNVQVAVNKTEYSAVMASISKRRGVISNTETQGSLFIMSADVPLSKLYLNWGHK